MSATKNPAIASLDPGSLCHSIYTELYNQFFSAQDRRDDLHPWGVEEGDDTSVLLHNTAYGFAYAIAGAVEGGGPGGSGGIQLEYLQKAGGDMSGPLRANYGFEAGIDNHRVLETFSTTEDWRGTIHGVKITGELHIGPNSLYIGDRNFIHYDNDSDTAFFELGTIDLGETNLETRSNITVKGLESGVVISPVSILIGEHLVYHQGNANLGSVDWSMLNASVAGDLSVSGKAILSGALRAVNGVELGADGRVMAVFREGEMTANCNISFGQDYGIKIGGKTVLGRIGASDIMIGGIGGDLLLGGGDTNKIKLVSGIMDTDADYMLLSPYGAAYFPDSLTVRHNYGDVLLSSYRVDSDNEGIVIHKKLRLGSSSGPYLYMDNDGIAFSSFFGYADNGTPRKVELDTVVRYGVSTSLFSPQDRIAGSLLIETQADSILFNKPVETKTHFAIDGSLTRLTAGSLYLKDDIYLLAISDGIKHYGNAYMLGDVSSEFFSSGFSGSGWAIQRNKTTGNTAATVDELTVRKKMRVYELEVQKISAANGAFWVSDSCSGDRVEKIS